MSLFQLKTPNATDEPSSTPSATNAPSATTEPSEPTATPAATAEPTPTPDIGDGAVVENKGFKYRVYVWDNNGALMDFGLIKLQDDGQS